MGRPMPTPIGHALAGLALALAARPLGESPVAFAQGARPTRIDWRLVALLAGLAAAPDLDLVFQPHRTATHSLVSIALVTILAAAVTGKVTPSPGRAWRLAVLCGAAWGSHLLLDWLGADTSTPRGVQLLWPFSDRWFISGWDVFRRIERRHAFAADTMTSNLRAVGQEILILLPVVAAAWLMRRRVRKDPAYE